jgi:regulator of RNase E activity RraA
MASAKPSRMSREPNATADAATVAETKTGQPAPDVDQDSRATLATLSTATIATVLLKNGFRNVWIRSAAPLHGEYGRLVGPAFTLRFVPAREDLATLDSLASGESTRAAVEAMPAGSVAVGDAMGIHRVGIFGDILCARMKARGVAGLVTDGAVRDAAGIGDVGLPVWCAAAASPPSVAALTFVGWQQPIACGGVAVFPGDVIVADADGAVVIPAGLVGEVVQSGPETDLFESWVMGQVLDGRRLQGLYPPDADARAEYEAWRASSARDR